MRLLLRTLDVGLAAGQRLVAASAPISSSGTHQLSHRKREATIVCSGQPAAHSAVAPQGRQGLTLDRARRQPQASLKSAVDDWKHRLAGTTPIEAGTVDSQLKTVA